MTFKNFIFPVIAAAVAASATYYAMRSPQHSGGSVEMRTMPTPTISSGEATLLRAENERLKRELADVRSEVTAQTTRKANSAAARESVPGGGSNPELVRLQLLADLQKRKLLSSNVTTLARDGKLTPQFAELFGLTAGEQASLQQDLNKARAHLDELQLNGAKVTKDDSGAVTLVMGSLAESPQIYDEVMDAFARNLGPERNAAFLTLGEPQLANAFGNYGAADQKFTLSRQTDPKNPSKVTYNLREERHTPNSNMSNSSSFRDLKSLQDRLGGIAKMIPPDF